MTTASASALAARASRRSRPATPATSPAESASASRSRSSPTGTRPRRARPRRPARGIDRLAKAHLAESCAAAPSAGQAVIVAPTIPVSTCACAERAVLLADGRVIADGPAAELLAGGTLATSPPASSAAPRELRPAQAELLAARATAARDALELAGSAGPSPPSRSSGACCWWAGSPTSARGSPRDRHGHRHARRRSALGATLSWRAESAHHGDRARRRLRALGPLPGFTWAHPDTASNVILGQGPTPPGRWPAWESSSSGRRARRLTGGRLGRMALALACASPRSPPRRS